MDIRIIEHDPAGTIHVEGISEGRRIEVLANPHSSRMMAVSARVVLSGWRPGLRKVALATLLRERTGMSLHDAHQCVNKLLDDQTIAVDVPTLAAASALAREADDLGVRTAMVDSVVTT